MTDLHFDIEVGQSYAAVVEAMANHLADIAFFGPVTFLQAKERAGPELLAVASFGFSLPCKGPSWWSCSACRWPSGAPEFEITGRTRHFVNAFGENVIVEEVEGALVEACQQSGAEVVECTVAPRYPTPSEARGGHDWLVEFRVPPRDMDLFARALDDALILRNNDYRTKRRGEVGMLPPRVIDLPSGTFYRWLRDCGKLGDQHNVPRATNNRVVAGRAAEPGGVIGRALMTARLRVVQLPSPLLPPRGHRTTPEAP